MDYSEKIRIDEEALDLEWLDQPQRMLEITQLLADAKANMDDAADALDLEVAELDKKIRSNPEKYDLEKTTDKVVENAIIRQKSYIDAKREYLDARYEYDVAKGAVQAFEQRKSALENLVKLHGQEYFAGPRVPRDLPKERKNKVQKDKEASKKLKSGIAKKLKRTKKE